MDLKIGLEETRKKILDILKVKDMTISQLAEALGKDQSTIYRHVKKLEEAGFIEVTSERKEYHIPEKIYGRTAEVFLLAPEPMDKNKPSGLGLEWKKERIKRCLGILEKAGFECEEKSEVADKLIKLFGKVDEEVTMDMGESLSDPEDADFFSLILAKFLAEIIKIENDETMNEKLKEIASEFENV
ncbi:MAG: ArsR/SmtB family transcription factor [Candidatus Aenigmatarchaeota archaeon]